MALSHKAKRRWSLVILLIGLPVYIVVASSIVTWLAPGSVLLEFAIYMALGVLWALPFKGIFRGVGQADPDRRD